LFGFQKPYKTVVFTALAVCFSFSSYAQTLILSGMLKEQDSNRRLEDCQVVVYKNGDEMDQFNTGKSGKYELDLELGYVYDIKISKAGYVYKILRFDTQNINEEDKAGGFAKEPDVYLFPMIEGFNMDLLKDPIGICKYNPQLNDLDWDLNYTNAQKKKIEDELKRLKNLAEKGAQMRAEFDKLMLEGDGKMGEKKWKDAMDKYQAALAILPQDAVAKQKYADAKAKYDAEMAALSADAEYLKLMKDGDDLKGQKKYTEAIKVYQSALKKKPAETDPKERIYECEQLIKGGANQEKYDKLIAEADAKFASADYQTAINKYKDAASLFPTIAYPKTQITKAQGLLDAQLAKAQEDARKEEQYNNQMALAAKNYQEKNYEGALTNYKEANRILPDRPEPPAKISELNQLLADIEKQRKDKEALDKKNNELAQLEADYQAKIQQADKLFKEDKLEEAKTEYSAASQVKPAEKYPQSRIQEIDNLIRQREEQKKEAEASAVAANEAAKLDAEYQKRVDAANQLYNEDKLVEAKSGYESALEIKPAEKYPKSRIALIEQRLKEAEDKAKRDQEDALNALAAQERLRAQQDSAAEASRIAATEAAEALAKQQLEDEQKRIAEQLALEEKLREEEEARMKALANIDNSRETEVEEYYREAMRREYMAKCDKVNDKAKSANDQLVYAQNSSDLRIDKASDKVNSQKDLLTSVFVTGSALQLEGTADVLRKQDQNSRNFEDYSSKADSRRGNASEKAEKDKEKQSKTSNGNSRAVRGAEEVKEKQNYFNETNKMYESRGETLRSDNIREAERKKEAQSTTSYSGEELRKENEKAAEEKKELATKHTEDTRLAAEERLDMNLNTIEEDKRLLESIGTEKEALIESRLIEVEARKQNEELLYLNKENESARKRYKNRMTAYGKKIPQEKTPEEYKAVPGTESLSEGVTEKSYEVGNKNITERTVKIGNKVDVYHKCVSKYGIAYFKNGKSITKERWIQETLSGE
jgi:tetratricopeptide (TPR) repeat protein